MMSTTLKIENAHNLYLKKYNLSCMVMHMYYINNNFFKFLMSSPGSFSLLLFSPGSFSLLLFAPAPHSWMIHGPCPTYDIALGPDISVHIKT